ncbi:UAA transporter [Dipodascopsis uninucleata]
MSKGSNAKSKAVLESKQLKETVAQQQSAVIDLVINALGIYASFLTWAVLQEKISTTTYGDDNRIFKYPLIINTIQSLCAAVVGYIYNIMVSDRDNQPRTVFFNPSVMTQLSLVALTQSLASPFGYAALNHIDYLTLLLGKSCKLLPVITLHVLIYRKRYPLYKYIVVIVVTAGVSVFTIAHPSASKKLSNSSGSSMYGLFLLGINLLLDGLTNSTQDNLFHSYKLMNGPKMMCGVNTVSTALTIVAVLSPFTHQFGEALNFFQLHPKVLGDIILFSLCGAFGQVFIFRTLDRFDSLTLVTITVTRKMISMLLSVMWFNHHLTRNQWIGVFMVFGGVAAEAYIKYFEKKNVAKTKQ